MTTPNQSNDPQHPSHSSNPPEAKGSTRRLFLLVGLLALALFALWYDYKVARPAVEQAYEKVVAKNEEINSESKARRMTNADVQSALQRMPSETFLNGKYTIEAYRWNAGMPLELRGLNGEDSPGIGLKTHDYYAVYRKDGQELAFVTHFKFDLESDYFDETRRVVEEDSVPPEGGPPPMAMPGMGGGGPGGGGPGPGGPGPGGAGGRGGFDPEAIFAERDTDSDGKLTGTEISANMRLRMSGMDTDEDGAVSKEEFLAAFRSRGRGRGGPGGAGGGSEGPGREGEDGGRRQRPPLEGDDAPAAEATLSDTSPPAEPEEAPGTTTREGTATEDPAEATPEASEDTAKEASSES